MPSTAQVMMGTNIVDGLHAGSGLTLSSKDSTEQPTLSWNIGKTGTSYADELFPVSGLANGNTSRISDNTRKTTTSDNKTKHSVTKQNGNTVIAKSILNFRDDNSNKSDEEFLTMEENLKIK
eukprot:12947592-Ditylum_brightwellii.AAC.2